MTPRQLGAILFIADKERTRERAEALSLGVLAARGDLKHVKKQLEDWAKS